MNVREGPGLLRSTRDMYTVATGFGPQRQLVVWSFGVLAQLLAGVVWHDEPDHCRAWAGGRYDGHCRCDVEAA